MTGRDVVDLLLDQHDQINNLIRRVQSAHGAAKQELFRQLVRLLAIHATVEEEVIHPTVRTDIESGEEIVDEWLREEHETKHVLAELDDLGADHPEFDAKFNVLAESVVSHVECEERVEFQALRQWLPEDRLFNMASALRAAEAVAPTHPHPATGESAAVNIMAGPPIALFDWLRDAVRQWRGKPAPR